MKKLYIVGALWLEANKSGHGCDVMRSATLSPDEGNFDPRKYYTIRFVHASTADALTRPNDCTFEVTTNHGELLGGNADFELVEENPVKLPSTEVYMVEKTSGIDTWTLGAYRFLRDAREKAQDAYSRMVAADLRAVEITIAAYKVACTMTEAQYDETGDNPFKIENGVLLGSVGDLAAVKLDGEWLLYDMSSSDAPSVYSPEFLAKLVGKSVSRVYQVAKELGRMPFPHEMLDKQAGRPRKY